MKTIRLALAFCTIVGLLIAPAGVEPCHGAEPVRLDHYVRGQIMGGAKTLPVAARLAYHDAIERLRKKEAGAEDDLHRAIAFDPSFSDAYFTLARLKAKSFDPQSLTYLVGGMRAMWSDFYNQSLFAANTLVILPYSMILVSLIFCFALAIKYLPFVAHQIIEFFKTRLRAAFPRVSAYLILLVPLVLFPGIITALGYLIAICWMFMVRRERFAVIMLTAPFIILGVFAPHFKPLSSITDPASATSLILRANDSATDKTLIRSLERVTTEGLEAERNIALGLLHQRAWDYPTAGDYFFKAISHNPEKSAGYINLGNVHFLEGRYEKALEGYRKAESIDPNDPISHYDQAQAYIKTMLMKESSNSLQRAAMLGMDKVKASYANVAQQNMVVYPRTFTNKELWNIALIDGASTTSDYLDDLLIPFTHFPRQTSGWVLFGAIILGIVLTRVIKPSKRTFQCTNCGDLTCEQCCNDEREMIVCRSCAEAVKDVTSDKVIDALLRQKRQTVLIQRKKSMRLVSLIFPGVRDISYGRILRGFTLALLFSFSVVQILTRGYLIEDPRLVVVDSPLWKVILPALGIVISYLLAVRSKPQLDLKMLKERARHHRSKEAAGERGGEPQVA